jgi:hypothetical protein
MAERVVLLGPQPDTGGVGTYCHALEMTALDADALRQGGIVKVRIAQFSGDLANATVLDLTDEYISKHGSYEEAWAQIDGFLGHMRSVTRRQIKTPIPLWNGGCRTFTDDRKLVPEPGDLAILLEPVKLDRNETLLAGMNVLIDAVTPDAVVIKYHQNGLTRLLALPTTQVEAIP